MEKFNVPFSLEFHRFELSFIKLSLNLQNSFQKKEKYLNYLNEIETQNREISLRLERQRSKLAL